MKTIVPTMVVPDVLVPLVRLCPVLEGFALVKAPCNGVHPPITFLKPAKPIANVNVINPVYKSPLEVINPIVKPAVEIINPVIRPPVFNPVIKPIEPVFVKPPVLVNPIAKPPCADAFSFLKTIDPFLLKSLLQPPNSAVNQIAKPPSVDPFSLLRPIDPFLLKSLLQPPNPAVTVVSKTSVDAVVPASHFAPPAPPQSYTPPTPPTDQSSQPPKQETPTNGQHSLPPQPPQFNPQQHNGHPSHGFSVSSNSVLLQNYK